MIILVCGGRDFLNSGLLNSTLNKLHAETPISVLIEGDADGADRMAGAWAIKHGVQVAKCPANWAKYGRKAGPLRNAMMLKLKPDLVLAFPGGKGTANMVTQAQIAGIKTHEVRE